MDLKDFFLVKLKFLMIIVMTVPFSEFGGLVTGISLYRLKEVIN